MLLTNLFIILRILSNSLGNVFQKRLSEKKFHPFFINFTTYLFLSIISLFFIKNINWNSFSSYFWYFAAAGGLMGALGNGFLVQALKNGELSVLGPINSYKSLVSMIAGIFLLRETPHLLGFLGIILIIYGSYFIFDTLEEKFSFALLKRKDIQFRIYAMIFTATEAVFIKKVILESSVFVSFIVWCIFGAIFSFCLVLIAKINILSELKKTNTKILNKYLYLILCIGIMQLSTNYVFTYMNVSYALALFQLSSLVSVFLGYKIFKEKNITKKIIGSIIMIIGSVIIIFLG